jgi:hypothetical protein
MPEASEIRAQGLQPISYGWSLTNAGGEHVSRGRVNRWKLSIRATGFELRNRVKRLACSPPTLPNAIYISFDSLHYSYP